jgi:serine/threonine protein kinase/Tol biopolymer transport system component
VTIAVGSSLGAYEITALLGEGGMGRVFRAHDTRLKRDVAIKVLPEEFAVDAERTVRFRREAEALAALNHPHIAAIHDVFESAGCQFLVLELVDGETLAERIRRGPVPTTEAIAIARQIAEALEAAHERGIVHRDLKPANIKVTVGGRVKVLDFGLAKDLEASRSGAASLTHSPTFLGDATKAGVILGTAAYMSPEQARGLGVSAQADVWAFGCVLYELLTGRQPFSGPTVTDILAAIIRGEPEWSALPPEAAGVRSLLRRCLQKEPMRRLHHMGDARLELEELLDQPAVLPATRATPSRTPPPWPWILVTAIVAAVVGGAVALTTASRPASALTEMRLDIVTPPSPDPLSLAISPNGEKLVFAAMDGGVSRLWVRSLTAGTAQPLKGTELATYPFWSPDGRTIGFFADGKLKRINVDGGITQTLASAPIGAGGAWSSEGTIVFAPTVVGGLLRVSSAGGNTAQLTRNISSKQDGHSYPHFLPDGRHFIFHTTGLPDFRGIYIGSLDGTEPRRLMDADTSAFVTASGQLLFVRQGTLFAQSFDMTNLQPVGDPAAIADHLAFDANIGLAAVSVSRAGPFVYRTGGASGQRQLVWFDRKGAQTGTIGSPDAAVLFNPDLSPDGRMVVFNRTVDNQEVWMAEIARGVLRRFTFDPGSDQVPAWSADGKSIAFSSNRKNAYDLYQKPSSGPGTEQLLLQTPENKFPMGYSPDGRHLLFRVTSPSTNWDLWALPLQGDRKPFPVVNSPFQEMMGEFSPDGGWIAYQSNESGQYEIYVQPFDETGTRVQISTAGGSQPRWRRDGKELFYVALDGRMMAARVALGAGRQLEALSTAEPLFMTRMAGGPVPSPQKQQYAVAADGRFLINSRSDEATTSPITLVLNWKPSATR